MGVWTELGIEIGLIILTGITGGVTGTITHEYLHWIGGKITNGEPYFTDKKLGIPTAVGFNSPNLMSDKGVQLTGGIVLIFPVSLVAFALLVQISEIQENLRLMWLLFFLFGGCVVSETDMIAIRYPSTWKKLASGGKIGLEDMED
jgi:hypothetical protein